MLTNLNKIALKEAFYEAFEEIGFDNVAKAICLAPQFQWDHDPTDPYEDCPGG